VTLTDEICPHCKGKLRYNSAERIIQCLCGWERELNEGEEMPGKYDYLATKIMIDLKEGISRADCEEKYGMARGAISQLLVRWQQTGLISKDFKTIDGRKLPHPRGEYAAQNETRPPKSETKAPASETVSREVLAELIKFVETEIPKALDSRLCVMKQINVCLRVLQERI
jgi:hypothetical protein